MFRDYLLLEQIGVGGQAVVWSALSRSQHAIYAIKFNRILDSDQIHSEEVGIEQKLERLVRLEHAHILPLHEHGSEQHVRFMVSPYIPGGTLAHRIKSAPLSFEQVLKYGSEIASALDYLHGEGVIHRDLKSSNILLDLSDHTYLADFGLARLVSTSTLAFHTGHGTPPYAPPEQIRAQEITLKSDIFSFGILLFEMLTGQLPWNGQRQLGVEQLHSAQELPDPREYVPGLPALITDVLRRVTNADPELRPRSATEVLRMLYYVFKVPMEVRGDASNYDEAIARQVDARKLLRQGLAQWESSEGKLHMGLTKFALIDLQGDRPESESFRRFMLSQSLNYGHKDDEWWKAVAQPRDRLIVASALLAKDNDAIAGRVLDHLLRDTEILASARGLPRSMARALLAIGLNTREPVLRYKIIAGLRMLIRAGDGWEEPSFPPELIERLGEAALEDSEYGDAAAELIGHLRGPSAVNVILNSNREGRKIDALLLVQRVAGSLPAFVPRGVRLRLSLDWMLQRFTQQPVRLLGAYVLAFLGAALSVFLQNYVTIRLPNYFDITRLTTSLERGLITGSLCGLGIFFARLIVERFPMSSLPLRIFLGTTVGGTILSIALTVFHILFVRTFPSGLLITLGCLMIAFGFTVGGFLRSLPARMVLAIGAVFVAILGTWLIHFNLASSPLELTPLFKYEYTWPLAQVVVTVLAVSIPMGVLGSLLRLELKDEYS